MKLIEFFVFVFSIFLGSFLTYQLGYVNAIQDKKEVPYLCRVKNVEIGIYSSYQSFYLIEGQLKEGEGHVIVEIVEKNETKIIDKTAFSKPEDFNWYIKVRFFDFNNDKRFDFAFPCGFKIYSIKVGC